MNRLFVALRPPPEVRAALLSVMGGIEGARWQSDAQLHLTLAFIGDVDRHGLEAAVEALALVKRPAFPLRLSSVGSFDAGRADRTAVLWAGVAGGGELETLAAACRGGLKRAGLPVDGRRFTPHITLARFGHGGAPRDGLRPWLGAVQLPPAGWEAGAFHLAESRMGAGGSHYTPVASYRLQPGPVRESSAGPRPPSP